jgi:hypothetical protein
LREAQLWVLDHPDELRGAVLEGEDERTRRAPPGLWAVFMLSGDWR